MQEVRCGVLVMGGGAAAMRAAIAAHDSGAEVCIVSKQTPGYSGNTVIARSGHSAPFSEPDLPEIFFADVIKGGEAVNHQPMVRALSEEGCDRIEELVSWGVPFLTRDGRIETQPSAGHTYPRGCYTVKNIATEVARPATDWCWTARRTSAGCGPTRSGCARCCGTCCRTPASSPRRATSRCR